MLPIVLLQVICNFLNAIDRILIRSVSKQFRLLKITDLYNIDKKYLAKLNNLILSQYNDVIELDARYCIDAIDLNHMKKLKKLNIGHDINDIRKCGVDDRGIQGLVNLEELYAHNNPKITTLNHMILLKKINISGNCGVDDRGIQGLLNLEELYAWNNPKITTLNHMILLKKIDISGNCGVDDRGIQGLVNLEELYAWNNPKITTLNHMILLKKINISGNCGVDDRGIQGLLNLEELNAWITQR